MSGEQQRGARAVSITTPYIKLDALLKLSGLAGSGGQAKQIIADGQVRVCGTVCLERGKKLRPGDRVEALGRVLRVEAETA